jgi:hypothetical protein
MASRQDYIKRPFGYDPADYASLLEKIKRTEDSFNTPGSQIARDPSSYGATNEDLYNTKESKDLVDEGYAGVAQTKSFERQRKIDVQGRVQAEQIRAESMAAQSQAEINTEREKLRTEITMQLMERGMSGVHSASVANKVLLNQADLLTPEEEAAFQAAVENKKLEEQIQRAAEKLTVQGQDIQGNPVIQTASPEQMAQYAQNVRGTYQAYKTPIPQAQKNPVGNQIVRNAQGKLVTLPPGMTMNREGYIVNEQPEIVGASAQPTPKATPKQTFQQRHAQAQGANKPAPEQIGGVEVPQDNGEGFWDTIAKAVDTTASDEDYKKSAAYYVAQYKGNLPAREIMKNAIQRDPKNKKFLLEVARTLGLSK